MRTQGPRVMESTCNTTPPPLHSPLKKGSGSDYCLLNQCLEMSMSTLTVTPGTLLYGHILKWMKVLAGMLPI